MKIFWYCLLFFFLPFLLSAQSPYQINWKVDGPIMGGGAGLILVGVAMQSRISAVTAADTASLNSQVINAFDRAAIFNESEFARASSDYLLYSSAVYPFLLLLDNKINKDVYNVGVLLTETVLVSTGLNSFTKGLVKRPRPSLYNPEILLEDKMESNAKLSFYSGHTNTVATLSFFTAKVWSDYHPDSKWKPVVWTIAAVLPAAAGFTRYKAGRHFPTDVIVGYVLGGATGWLIPHLHLKKEQRVGFRPMVVPGFTGAHLTINLN